jgi:CRISPR-associated protein Csb2
MVVIELTFPSGRFHATPWGRHVNEGVPEWPPSTYRMLRALYDTWKRKRPEWDEHRVERFLRPLASFPPVLRLPRASVSHTRSFLSKNEEDPLARTLIFDAFVALSPRSALLIAWPEVSLDAEVQADLDELLSLLNFFGRSESWVSGRVLEGITTVDWNCAPITAAESGPELEIVPVASPVPPEEYEAHPFNIGPSAKKKKGRVLSWLDALSYSTADLLDSRRSEPPAMRYLNYGRRADCFTVTPESHARGAAPPVQGVLYALECKVLPQVITTLEVAERVHRKLMGIHKALVANPVQVSPKFSGKDPSGTPLKGHGHLFIWPLDKDHDGKLDHLLVVCRQPLDLVEQMALDRLSSLWQPDGKPDIRCVPLQWGNLGQLLRPARKWTSATPFVPPRHYRRGRGTLAQWLRNELKRECANHGLPAPERITFVDQAPFGDGRSFRWLEFRRNRKGDTSRVGYGSELGFAEPVAGPFALGYGCHFGLGQFHAVLE